MIRTTRPTLYVLQMKTVSLIALAAGWLTAGIAADTKPAAPAAPAATPAPSVFKDERDKVSYSLGLNLGNFVKRQEFEPNTDQIVKAIRDVLDGKTPALDENEMRTTMMAWQKSQKEKGDARRKEEGAKYLAENKTKEGVKTTASGLQYKVITPGDGPSPTTNEIVSVNYRGTLINGTEFDSSYKRGRPAEFPVTGVIKGWTEALLMMKKGAKWQLTLPAEIAYGDRGTPNIPGNSVLNFEVELLDIKAKTPPPTPSGAGAGAAGGQPVVTSDIIKVPSADGLKKGEKIEVIKASDLDKLQKEAEAAKKPADKK